MRLYVVGTGLLLCFAATAWTAALGQAGQPALAATSAPDWRQQVEQDWLTQLELKQKGYKPIFSVSMVADAAGGVDGVKDGKYGFHTNSDSQPWWQVDLGKVQGLSRAVIYNRCDTADRTSRLAILLSEDGKAWKEAYRHSGTPFHGVIGGKPLEVDLAGAKARFVRAQLPEAGYFHLDEVEVYAVEQPARNIALGQPADQSSVSTWSTAKIKVAKAELGTFPVEEAVALGRQLADDLRGAGGKVDSAVKELAAVEAAWAVSASAAPAERKAIYLRARWAVRSLELANPLLDFDDILFVKRVPSSYSHMSDQNYGWFSRPGGGLYVLERFRSDTPNLRCLTAGLAPGNVNSPDLSYDGKKVLFAYCKFYKGVAGNGNKVDKARLPDDSFYHVYEVNIDGTGLRQLTRGRYDDFDARYLPGSPGDIVFLSTRRGQFTQCDRAAGAATMAATLPDSYVRCGGGSGRPVAVYTLHRMDGDGRSIWPISAFESFEWTPSVAADGSILYARWDYVDRSNMPFMKLWATSPDGTNPFLVWGNFTRNTHCAFEARSIPRSSRIIMTMSAHHAITGGSLVMLDPDMPSEGASSLTRLTPEVCFPEIEGWPATYYANPWPLSERHCLTAWSNRPINSEGGGNPANGLGIYLYDAKLGIREPLHRDPEIGSQFPIPVRPRVTPPTPPSRAAQADESGQTPEGQFMLTNVYHGLPASGGGSVRELRIVFVPQKTQPSMNSPSIGATGDDPGKCVLGTVPVEADGSANFRVPAGVGFFFQAIGGDGTAVQTMRTLTYVQPGQTLSCMGCHESRNVAPPVGRVPQAASRPPSLVRPGPEGSWPLRFDKLVQPVLDRNCVRCHSPSSADSKAAAIDLTPARAYKTLFEWGRPSLRQQVQSRYGQSLSIPGDGIAATSRLLPVLLNGCKGAPGVRLDREGLDRLIVWMDTYAQRQGHFSDEQERQLADLRRKWAGLLDTSGPAGPVNRAATSQADGEIR